MLKFIITLVLLLCPFLCLAESGLSDGTLYDGSLSGYSTLYAFPIGSSVLRDGLGELCEINPNNYHIIHTTRSYTLGWRTLAAYVDGRGSGVCVQDEFYGCLEAEPQIDLIIVWQLTINNCLFWGSGEWESYNALLAGWRNFYGNLHNDFGAPIVHIFLYPLKIAAYGSTDPAIPDCEEGEGGATLNSCMAQLKNDLQTNNADLSYVHYIDAWQNIRDTYNDADLLTWQNARFYDNMHMYPDKYKDLWDTWLEDEFKKITDNLK